MRNLLTIIFAIMATLNIGAAKTPITLEPANWFVGMKDPTVQVLLSAPGIRDAAVTTDYPGVTIDSLVRLDSPNYLFVYLNVKDAQPGNVVFKISGKATATFPLLAREKAGEERYGFTKKDVLYMFMPDRFAQGHKDNSKVKTRYPYVIDRKAPSLRHGGDLEGIRQHLDYFTDLGVTALWLAPVLENDQTEDATNSCYHGYATTNYYRVDPRFGTNEEYRQLCDEAHQKGLKVVMDMIFNHCGDMHPWMKDAPSKDWFNEPDYGLQTSYKLTPTIDPYASEVDMRETVNGWFVSSMPDLNQRNPHLMRYLIQNSEWWIETVGIDGIRMDTYPYADANAMAHWMKVLNTEYPNFNVVGESWVTEPGFTSALQANSGRTINVLTADGKVVPMASRSSNLNTVMDFTFYDRLSQAKTEETDGFWEGLNRIYNGFVYDGLYADPSNVLAFLDNHDTDRFLGNTQDTLMLKQGLALLLTINRIPQIYYGTEIMMNGTKEITDGHVREDFPGGFPGDERNAFTAEGRTKVENTMFNWLRKVLHWRQGCKAITEGKQKQFIPYNGVYVMSHTAPDSKVIVILNGTKKQATFDVARYKELFGDDNDKIYREVTSGRKYDLSKNLRLSPRQTLILELRF